MERSTTFATQRTRRLRATLGTICVSAAALLSASSAFGQSLSDFAILAGSTITNTGTTTINGSIGLSPGSAITGQGPGANAFVLTGGTIHIADGVAVQAKSDLTTAFNVLMGRPATSLSGNLGNRTLLAGVYNYSSDAQLTGTLTLDGGPDDVFIIQVGSSLTTASNSAIVLTGQVQAANVFFVVGESATLGTTTAFQGQILAGTSITLNNHATIACGAAYAQTGAVTLDSNTIGICTFDVATGDLGDVLGDEGTDIDNAVLDGIDNYIADNGDLPLGFQVLALLSPEELAEALGQMSGEIATGVAPAGMQGMDSFLSLLRGSHGGGSDLLTATGNDYDFGNAQPLSGQTVSVMGYLPVHAPAGEGAFDGFDAQTPSNPGDWSVWAAGFGSRTLTDGDSDVGTHDRTSTDFGTAFGFERQVDADTMFGLAVSGGGTNFALDDSLGSGKSAMLMAAAYARTNLDDAYVAATVAVGTHHVTTDRYLTFAGLDHYSAEFDATGVAGEVEAGYHFGWFTPYVALRGQLLSTPAYGETTESGASTFALDYAASTATTLRTEIGARADWSTAFGDGGVLTLSASAAWAHDYRQDDGTSAAFQALPGSDFAVGGATGNSDSLLAAAGAQLTLGNGLALSATINGRVSENEVNYGGTAGVKYSW